MLQYHCVFTAVLLMAASGCMSFSSTVLNRFDDNSFAGDSNGHEKAFGQTRPFKGIPITLKVPTHLDVYIDENYYIKLDEKRATEPLAGQTRLYAVRPVVIKSDKVFIVDFKRPGSGTLDLKLSFDEEEQYFKKIVSDLEDTTITDTATLVGTVIKRFGAFSVSKSLTPEDESKLEDKHIFRDTRVVAYQRFDINSPSFERDVECFVNQHLNACNRCGTQPDYDGNLAADMIP